MTSDKMDANVSFDLKFENSGTCLEMSETDEEYLDMSELCDMDNASTETNSKTESRINSPSDNHTMTLSYAKSTDNPALTEKSKDKSRYKHVPHREKPMQVVVKRNARERRRVQTVNSAFLSLRKRIPYENRHKRLSKVKTLRIAIDYIRQLEQMLGDHDSVLDGLLGNSHVITDMQELTNDPGHAQPTHVMPMQQYQALPQVPMTVPARMELPQLQYGNAASNLFAESGSFLDLIQTSSDLSSTGTTLDWGNTARDIQEFLQLPD